MKVGPEKGEKSKECMKVKNNWVCKFARIENPEHIWKDCPIRVGGILSVLQYEMKRKNTSLHILGETLRELLSDDFYLISQEGSLPIMYRLRLAIRASRREDLKLLL